MTSAEQPALDPGAEIAAARLEMAAGRADDAVRRLQDLIGAAAFDPLHHYWLAAAQGAAGDWRAHHQTLKQAQTFHALKAMQAADADLLRFHQDADYAVSVAAAFRDLDRVAVASVGFGRGTMSDDALLSTLLSYGLNLQYQGRLDEALAAFAWAHESSPGSPAQDFLLAALAYAEDGPRRQAEEAQRWRRKFGPAAQPSPDSFAGADQPVGPLRIGYFIPEFGAEARRSLAPVLDHHDAETVSVTLYLQAHDPAQPVRADAVRMIGEMDDAAVADLIRLDRIDVLVDLWGHGPGGRLGVFLRRPAPVQASWMNNVQTTGAPEINYLIHADAMEVAGAQEDCVETIWRLGPVLSPFRPGERGAPSPTPARANGFVTFGYDGPPAGLNDPTLDALARILARVPGSRLRLRNRYLVDDVLQNAILIRLAARGVDIEQVSFSAAVESDAEAFAGVDVALDASPGPDVTLGCRAVAHGVPFLTLAGSDYLSRVGATVVVSLGLDELAARSWDDYVERAAGLASDIEALGALRARVRDAFDRSEWRDEAGFTRRLEAAFHDMFAHWRARQEDRTAA